MVILMDGGMGSELSRRGASNRTDLWSARALVEDPDTVKAVHLDYIKAGARIIITNSYSTIPSYLSKEGLEHRYEELTGLAGKIARQAAVESGEAVEVLGSLPPMSESYRPDLAPIESVSSPIYEAMAKAIGPHVDGFICETMATAEEAHSAASAACKVAKATGQKVFVSWTLDEEPGAGLRSGESIRQAFERVSHLPIDGFLTNCTHPVAVEAGLKELAALTDKPIGGYANNMEDVPKDWTLDSMRIGRRNDGPERYGEAARRWIAAGASMIGGCCGIGPEHIDFLAREVISETA